MAKPKALLVDARPRRPPTRGYPRGVRTRSRIIAASLDVFGTYGFAGATTRMLAQRAGVTLPALQYYFDGKEGVYLACADHIAERLQARLGSQTAQIAQTLATERAPRQRLLDLLLGFFDSFAELFLGGHDMEKWVMFIIREQAQPTRAFDIIFERVMRSVAETCAKLVGRLLDLPDNDHTVRARTLALIGQIVFFRTAREAALRVMRWPDFGGDRLPLVKSALRAQIKAAFALGADGSCEAVP